MTIVMVANDQQVKEVVMGDQGLLAAVDPQKPPRAAVMSTVLP
jgi:3-hydroxyisobutyrate dehydrogenase-like beta-hydroxyacid dehydrogenase